MHFALFAVHVRPVGAYLPLSVLFPTPYRVQLFEPWHSLVPARYSSWSLATTSVEPPRPRRSRNYFGYYDHVNNCHSAAILVLLWCVQPASCPDFVDMLTSN